MRVISSHHVVVLQDRNLSLQGNILHGAVWDYQTQLTKIPSWTRSLFQGDCRSKLRNLELYGCGLNTIGGDSGTSFRGLHSLETLPLVVCL